MDYIYLGNGYLLTGFDNFESALSATEKLCGSGFKIEYLNESAYIRDEEVMEFTRSFSPTLEQANQGPGMSWTAYGKGEAKQQLSKAISELEESTNQKVKFIMILKTKK